MKKYLLIIAIFLGCVGCTEDKVNSPSEQETPEPPKKEEVIKVIEHIHAGYGDHVVTEVDGHRFYTVIRYEGGVALIHLPSCKCFKDSVK